MVAGRQEGGDGAEQRRCVNGGGGGGGGGGGRRPSSSTAQHAAAAAARALLSDRRPDSPADVRRLVREYAAVVERDADLQAALPCSHSMSRRAHGRNRYRDVLPYDGNRVRLPAPPAAPPPEAEGGGGGSNSGSASANDYINASHVVVRLDRTEVPERAAGARDDEDDEDDDPVVAAALASAAAAAAAGGAEGQGAAAARYVAAQGPLPSTSADFWAMVAALGSPAIVMLTNVVERGAPKCHQYFPTGGGGGEGGGGGGGAEGSDGAAAQQAPSSELSLPSRGLVVRCVHVSHGVPPEAAPPLAPGARRQQQNGPASPAAATAAAARDAVTVRRLQLRCASSGRVLHELDHYHLHAWPDHGVPAGGEGGAPVRALCRALELSRQQRRRAAAAAAAAAATAATHEAPVVVHCSAGIGRTGTFCAVDVLLRRMWAHAGPPRRQPRPNGGQDEEQQQQDGGGDRAGPALSPLLFDVPSLVVALRAQRMGMVQTFEQYAYVGTAALEEAAALAAGAQPPSLLAGAAAEAAEASTPPRPGAV
jgi:protein tyrosine phosphatase